MPAYNFKKEFAPMILSGRKPHTIRKVRKNPTEVGDTLYLYTGMRTKKCEKIAEAVCTRIEPVIIWPDRDEIGFVDHQGGSILMLDDDEIKSLAYADGFDSVVDFFDFFMDTYGDPDAYMNELDGFEIIYWGELESKNANKN